MGQIGGGGRGVAHGEFHVGLAGGDPDIADEDVVNDDFLRVGRGALNGDVEGAACLAGLEVNAEAAEAVAFASDGLTAEGDADLLADRSASPDMHGKIALDHHVV